MATPVEQFLFIHTVLLLTTTQLDVSKYILYNLQFCCGMTFLPTSFLKFVTGLRRISENFFFFSENIKNTSLDIFAFFYVFKLTFITTFNITLNSLRVTGTTEARV